MKNLISLLCLLICAGDPHLASSQDQAQIIENYVKEALQTNHGLMAKTFEWKKNVVALEEARRLFLPEVGLGATYSLAEGGRNILFPVGDLMNPVYSTLNTLTQSNLFPQIENVEEQFLPNNFYDVHLRIRQPLLNREISYNRKIREESIGLSQLDVQLYKRELVRDVKQAYFRYLQSEDAVRIYDNALQLLFEYQKVNESLLRNDKIIPSVLDRIKSEIAQVQATRNQAESDRKNAAAYFNFLLNRDLNADIERAEKPQAGWDPDYNPETFPEKREEWQQLITSRNLQALVVDWKNAYKIPQVGLQVDLGSQNFDFKPGGYIIAGLSLEVPIWAANRNDLKVQQAEWDVRVTEKNMDQLKEQLQLQVLSIRNELQAQQETWKSFEAQLDYARRQYNDTFRRYKEDKSNYLELLDARNQVTLTELQRSISYYSVRIQQAELERALASYPLP